MCGTKYINNLFAGTSHVENIIPVHMKRTDGELFSVNLILNDKDDARKIKELLNYFEELRTCSCTKFSVCEKHSDLRKVS